MTTDTLGAIATSSPPGPRVRTHSGSIERRDVDRLRRIELADFLRSRRERITPEQVGYPTSGRRRTPGLRREEVAQLAGVGVTWYTWLEQGRKINASPQVLDAVSRTLMLDRHERSHLFRLAGSPLSDAEGECNALHPAVRVLLAELTHVPAIVTNSRRDVLAFNPMFDLLVEGISNVPWDDRNILWLVFTDPRWRERLLDWDEGAPRMVAQFRAAMADHMGEPAWKCLLKRLISASPEFAEMWKRHDVEGQETRTKRILHPDVGLLRLDYTYLWLGPTNGNRLVTYTPVDEETAERLRVLRGSITVTA